ncbi:ABC transporter ATP-binding protein [Arcobacter peruensis]|uniref:ABC transporter ATP-binding protein n=1 Tax=Arcobacter peruensis TaxID=2320140 RepID=UPI000F098BB7|nr:ABC transporter ATP-binding protein [Arcobacter peruensis]
MLGVELKNVVKAYEGTTIIQGANLQIKKGEFVVFVGPSGCGKSTLMRTIAGLEEITSGEISIHGEVINDTPPSKRGVAMVFQSYALYPHMNVYDNMSFSLKLQKVPKAEIDQRVQKAAKSLQMTNLLDRLPKNLSGGQRQRVAIGRAIIREPKVFLFDEPLSNLDANLRSNTRIEIAKLHKHLEATMLYVTHDQVEAMTLADRIVVLNKGVIQQFGSPDELYNSPDNLFVAGFIGSPKMNFIETSNSNEAKNIVEKSDIDDKASVKTVGVRPEHIDLCQRDEADFTGTVDLVEHLGEYVIYYVSLSNEQLITVKSVQDHLKVGDEIFINSANKRFYFFDNEDKAIK